VKREEEETRGGSHRWHLPAKFFDSVKETHTDFQLRIFWWPPHPRKGNSVKKKFGEKERLRPLLRIANRHLQQRVVGSGRGGEEKQKAVTFCSKNRELTERPLSARVRAPRGGNLIATEKKKKGGWSKRKRKSLENIFGAQNVQKGEWGNKKHDKKDIKETRKKKKKQGKEKKSHLKKEGPQVTKVTILKEKRVKNGAVRKTNPKVRLTLHAKKRVRKGESP